MQYRHISGKIPITIKVAMLYHYCTENSRELSSTGSVVYHILQTSWLIEDLQTDIANEDMWVLKVPGQRCRRELLITGNDINKRKYELWNICTARFRKPSEQIKRTAGLSVRNSCIFLAFPYLNIIYFPDLCQNYER